MNLDREKMIAAGGCGFCKNTGVKVADHDGVRTCLHCGGAGPFILEVIRLRAQMSTPTNRRTGPSECQRLVRSIRAEDPNADLDSITHDLVALRELHLALKVSSADLSVDFPDGLELTKTSQEGGDVIFMGGNAGTDPDLPPAKSVSVYFKLSDGTEMMRIDDSGEFFVNGNLVASDREVYDGFRKWLSTCLLVGA